MTLVKDATYRFLNRAAENEASGAGRSLNVYGNSPSYLANVCLYTSNNNDICQQWVYKESGGHKYLACKGNPSLVLDLFTDSSAAANVNNYNAHVFNQVTNTCYLKIEDASDGDPDYIQIKLESYTNKYLTANQGSNGTSGGKDVNAAGNVYFYSGGLTDYSQDWKPIRLDGGSTPEPDPEPSEFVWPTESRQITNYQGSNHAGIDIGPLVHQVPGDEIYAFTDGVVSAVVTPTTNPNEGYSVRIHHVNPLNNGYENIRSQYMHMDSMPLVSTGQSVTAGMLIGYMGNTGNVYPEPTEDKPGAGTHLHFEVRGGSEDDFPLGGTSTFYTGTVLQAINYLNLCD